MRWGETQRCDSFDGVVSVWVERRILHGGRKERAEERKNEKENNFKNKRKEY